jgi:hypothetical protein
VMCPSTPAVDRYFWPGMAGCDTSTV